MCLRTAAMPRADNNGSRIVNSDNCSLIHTQVHTISHTHTHIFTHTRREVLDVCTAASAWERSYDIFVSVSQHSAGNKAWANEVLGELPLQWNALALSLKPYQSGLFCFEVRLHVKVV
jgi:hypothetical protein